MFSSLETDFCISWCDIKIGLKHSSVNNTRVNDVKSVNGHLSFNKSLIIYIYGQDILGNNLGFVLHRKYCIALCFMSTVN